MSTDIFKQAFDLSPVGIGIVNGEHKIIYANEAYYELHGYTPEEVINQDAAHFIYSEDTPVLQQIEELLMTGKTDNYHMEVRIRRKDNKPAWAHIQGYIKRKPDGSIDYSVGFLTNITEKKLQEQELIIKSHAIACSLSPTVMVNLEGDIFYVNPAFVELWGYSHENEIIGKQPGDFIASAEKSQQYFERIREDGGLTGEETAVKKNGEHFYVRFTSALVKDKLGKPVCLMSSFEDITRQKRYEQDLLIKSHAIESSVTAMLMTDLRGDIFYVNQAFMQMWDFTSREDIIGKNFMVLASHIDVATHVFQQTKELANVISEHNPKRADGTSFHIRVSASVVKDSGGKPVCMMASLEDITQRKKYEEELMMKSHALASSKSGVFITNLSGEVVYVNKSMLEIGGYQSEADVIGKRSTQFRLPPDKVAAIQEIIRATGQWQGELQVPHTNGQFKDIELFASLVVNKQGQPLGTMTWITDISGRKQAERDFMLLNKDLEEKNSELLAQEEELRATNEELLSTVNELHTTQKELEQALQDLQHKNFELDQFVYKTSHDLRAPLTTILGLVELLKKEEDEATKNNYILLVENRIERLDNFIKSMLDYSKNARSQLVREPVQLVQLVEEGLHELEYMKNYRRLQITLEAAGEEVIYTDPFRLKIIVNNIISNAIKYQKENIPDSKLFIRVSIQSNQAELYFADNGIGIKQEYIDKIFNMFFRATDNAEGSGLGLYIVKQAVQALHGTISLKSEPGVGTETTIIIPA